ncbi:MAG: hypothetical protein II949_07030 [Prevotella sp.]|nr:hypothetical protein [Prevotella sp.]
MKQQSLHLIILIAATQRRLLALIGFLFITVGSAVASDPFGEVNTTKYPNTMTITGYVRMGGKVLGDETVVAVYQGDELRGKKSPMSTDKYTSILMMTIYGNDTSLPLHFKVFTDGRVIEVDQGLKFVTDARIGKAKDPYYIDLPAPVVTTPCNEGWATTCLPFNAEVPAGVDIWYATGIGHDELLMTRVLRNDDKPLCLPANTPVLLKSEGLASYEWLARVANGNFTTEGNILSGTTVDITVRAGSVLTLGYSESNGTLGFWRYSGTAIPANHAYIANTALPSGAIRGISLPDGSSTETSIALEPQTVTASTIVYDLLGRRINGQSQKPRKLCKQGILQF